MDTQHQFYQSGVFRVAAQFIVGVIFTFLYWWLSWQSSDGLFDLVLLGLGLASGSVLIFVDEKWLAAQYTEPNEIVHPLTKSIVFILALVPVGVFVLTSTASTLALGFFLGISSSLLSEMVLLSNNPEAIRQRFLWQLQRRMSDSEVKGLVAVLVLFILVLSILALW